MSERPDEPAAAARTRPSPAPRASLRLLLCAFLFAHAATASLSRARGQEGAGGQGAESRAGGGAATRTPDAERGRAPGATGSIKGRVIDEAGQPLAFAHVSARPPANRPDARRSFEATADEGGNFSIDNLDAGAYFVFAHAPGYLTSRESGTGDLAESSTYRTGQSATLRLIKGAVITGTVMDSSGAPVVAASARAVLLRRLDGSPPNAVNYWRENLTDDRGVYRIYGLAPGVYVVSAGGATQWRPGTPTPYDSDAPTYFPSSPRETAAEVSVRAGQEAAGIDIRYRGERGYTVSGRVEGAAAADFSDGGMQLLLSHAETGTVVALQWFMPHEAENGFAFDGLGDGDYELRARRPPRGDENSPALASKPVRVRVRGADVGGLRLTLAPLASLRGRVVLAPLAAAEREAAGCEGVAFVVQESIVYARRDEAGEAGAVPHPFSTTRADALPKAEGGFLLSGLDPGRYRVGARPLSGEWFLRSVTLPPPARAPQPSRGAPAGASARPAQAHAPAAPSEAGRPGEFVTLGAGQTLTDVTVTLAEGAASLRGRVSYATDASGAGDSALPPHLRVQLVPAAAGRAGAGESDNPLRYAEASVAEDGSFALKGLAPGRYLIFAHTREAAARDKPLAWDAAGRAALRREAEAAGRAVELRPCQHLDGYSLKLPPAPGEERSGREP